MKILKEKWLEALIAALVAFVTSLTATSCVASIV